MNTDEQILTTARLAGAWPTVNQLATRYQVHGRTIRKAIDAGQIIAFRLNVLRVEPASFAAWLTARQK